MDFSPAEQKIYDELNAYVSKQNFIFNPDAAVVARVVRGLSARENKTGRRYCPCRIVGKDENENLKIVCPCVYHQDEIAADGQCHCQLFVADKAQ